MTPRGAAPLIAMRMDGHRPRGFVWVSVGNFREPDWWKYSNTLGMPELLVRPEDPVERLDLRCVVGLPVILFFDEYNERVAAVYQRLIGVARAVAVESPSFGEDIGWVWSKTAGRFGFDGEAIVSEFE